MPYPGILNKNRDRMNRVDNLRSWGVALLLVGWIARYVCAQLKSEPKDPSFSSFAIHVGVFLLLITIW
jgi:hypothetical protein